MKKKQKKQYTKEVGGSETAYTVTNSVIVIVNITTIRLQILHLHI